LTVAFVPIVKPVALSDWILSAATAFAPSMSLETSPTIVEVRITASRGRASATWLLSTITTSGWKPTKIGRLSTPFPVYVPESTRIPLGPVSAVAAVNVGSGVTYFLTRTQSSTIPLAVMSSFQANTRRLASGRLVTLLPTGVPSWRKRTDAASRSNV
jgi:hypothetical protein